MLILFKYWFSFLPVYIYVYVCCAWSLSCVRLFATPPTVAQQAPLFMGFSRQRYWSVLPFPLPGDLPDLGIEAAPLVFPALGGGFFTASATWEALYRWVCCFLLCSLVCCISGFHVQVRSCNICLSLSDISCPLGLHGSFSEAALPKAAAIGWGLTACLRLSSHLNLHPGGLGFNHLPLPWIYQHLWLRAEKAMATPSSTLAWKIPGTGEPGGLPSMGSHRVGHDWSDSAAAAAVTLWVSLHFSIKEEKGALGLAVGSSLLHHSGEACLCCACANLTLCFFT